MHASQIGPAAVTYLLCGTKLRSLEAVCDHDGVSDAQRVSLVAASSSHRRMVGRDHRHQGHQDRYQHSHRHNSSLSSKLELLCGGRLMFECHTHCCERRTLLFMRGIGAQTPEPKCHSNPLKPQILLQIPFFSQHAHAATSHNRACLHP